MASDQQPQINVVAETGDFQAGLAFSGPLNGQRVVRHTGGTWFPAGNMTFYELVFRRMEPAKAL